MADLTIKPVGAAGNKLILQDQAGGDVLTTSDSGVDISNVVTLETSTTGKVKQKGAFMQSSTHQALVMGG